MCGLLLLCYWIGNNLPWGENWAPWLVCKVDTDAKPKGTRFVDLLLPINESDEYYCLFNESNGQKYGIDKNSEIVRLNEQGYRSYTFHLSPAAADIEASRLSFSFFSESTNDPASSWNYYACLERYRSMRLAFFDENGNVLSISNEAPIFDAGMSHRSHPERRSFHVTAKMSGGLLETKLLWDQRTILDSIYVGFIALLMFTWPVWLILLLVGLLILLRKNKRRFGT